MNWCALHDSSRRGDNVFISFPFTDHMLAYDRWFRQQVRVGLDQIERGEFVSHGEVGRRIDRVFRA